MCAVSSILDYGRRQWPNPNDFINIPVNPLPDPTAWLKYLELIQKAKDFDKAAKQLDCEDPEKVKWFAAMEKRMALIEKKLDKVLVNK